MTSKKQIEANRKNATKSTGPKTEAGKNAVSNNAFKHGGYFSKERLFNDDALQWEEEVFEAVKKETDAEGLLGEYFARGISYSMHAEEELYKLQRQSIQKRINQLKLKHVEQYHESQQSLLPGYKPPRLKHIDYLTKVDEDDIERQWELIAVIESSSYSLASHPQAIQYALALLTTNKAAKAASTSQSKVKASKSSSPSEKGQADKVLEQAKQYLQTLPKQEAVSLKNKLLKLENEKLDEMRDVFQFRDEFQRIEEEERHGTLEDFMKVQQATYRIRRQVSRELNSLNRLMLDRI